MPMTHVAPVKPNLRIIIEHPGIRGGQNGVYHLWGIVNGFAPPTPFTIELSRRLNAFTGPLANFQ